MILETYEQTVAAACVNPAEPYPANHFAFQHVLKTFPDAQKCSILEIGVGMGGAIPPFVAAGFAFAGIDRDLACVERSQAVLVEESLAPNRIVQADFEDFQSLRAISDLGNFDALIAMGVFPHLTSIRQGILNAANAVRPGGHIFLEFRNALFSLVTFNRYTREFICDRLLEDSSTEVRLAVDAELKKRINLEIPTGALHPETFHVPFEVVGLAQEVGLNSPKVIPFHFHAGMPAIEQEIALPYRLESVALENDSSGWKGLFLASAFLLHAQRPE